MDFRWNVNIDRALRGVYSLEEMSRNFYRTLYVRVLFDIRLKFLERDLVITENVKFLLQQETCRIFSVNLT